MPLDQTSGDQKITLIAPSIRCGSCIAPIEKVLATHPGVVSARVNLSTRRINAVIDPALTSPDRLVDVLGDAGFATREQGPEDMVLDDTIGKGLLLRLGVAGFAAMNVMLLSISVWSGADAATRDLLHWVSALIALPAIVYAGQPFFRSAATALTARRLNMDVPISLAVILSAGHSVMETANSAEHAYFDAGIMLLFFLLIGRYLEHRTRRSARSAATELMAMAGRTARHVQPDGQCETVPLSLLMPGMIVEVLPGERIPADGQLIAGSSDLDMALITGESTPEPATIGDKVHAGILNMTGAIRINVTATGDATLLAEVAGLVDAAEKGRGRFDQIADRAARVYAPFVHALAAIAFLGWYFTSGDPHLALKISVAVLIVTCPCALALAVPTVHTVTSLRLFQRGIFLKDGAELERLADVDLVVFDKTGTLTDGVPTLTSAPPADDPGWSVAAALAQASRHPCSNAISAEAKRLGIQSASIDGIRERPGLGVDGTWNGEVVRLGRPSRKDDTPGSVLSIPGREIVFQFGETIRPGAEDCCAAMREKGLDLVILSGDQKQAVARVADALGIESSQAGLLTDEKLEWLEHRRAEGRRVLMVGDGLNDGPALATAHASMSPASAVDVAKSAAGFVFVGRNLMAINTAHDAALIARRRALQSFAIAIGYNAVAIPMALTGFVTPLFAAAAMSLSSILVILNALRGGTAE